MNKRRPVQEEHELFVVNVFIEWWALQTNEHLRVISRPHPLPPEAIVQSDQRTTWIEVTDAFYSGEWAKDLYSYATPGESHKPMRSGSYEGIKPYTGMDEQIASRFATLLKKKLSKQSYTASYEKYGPGILLVGIQSPWFDEQTCDMVRAECRKTNWSTCQCYFSHVFIYFKQSFVRIALQAPAGDVLTVVPEA